MDKRKVRKFERLCNELAVLIEEMHEINSDILVFVESSGRTSINLVDTKGEDFDSWVSNQDECIITSVNLPHADCGGF